MDYGVWLKAYILWILKFCNTCIGMYKKIIIHTHRNEEMQTCGLGLMMYG